jgi:nucleoside phosphorylase
VPRRRRSPSTDALHEPPADGLHEAGSALATAPAPSALVPHPDRKEIGRYLLSRGLDRVDTASASAAGPATVTDPLLAAARPGAIPFPDGLAPQPQPLASTDPNAPLPEADVVVITWTVDELAALAKVMTPGVSAAHWQKYARNFAQYQPNIRRYAPAQNARRLGTYQPVQVGQRRVLCMKSDLHLNQDGIATGVGTATLPVKDFFHQIIAEAKPSLILTIGTAGSVFERFALGDVVVTRAAKFRLSQEFRNEPFNGQTYRSEWPLPSREAMRPAVTLMHLFADDLIEPPFAPPTKRFRFSSEPIQAPGNRPDLRLDGDDMPEFHPILTTDYFEYGTSANRLDREGAAVEMGDAALGLACSELADPPRWAAVRNMSDPVINGDLPAKDFHLNEQTTWAVGYYTAYGHYTSIVGALAAWGIVTSADNI